VAGFGQGTFNLPRTSHGVLLQYLPICRQMPQRFTALLLRLREHGVFFFLDMLRDGVHQLTEARSTRYGFRITGPQCHDQLPDAVGCLTRVLPQCFPLLRCLLGKGRIKTPFLPTAYRPTVCLGVTSAVAYTYGCGDGRIGPTRCALIVGARGDRWSRCQGCRTPPAGACSARSGLVAGSRRASTAAPGGFPRSRTTPRRESEAIRKHCLAK
jgi:hypothetical protein